MRCPNCSAVVAPGLGYCTSCGQPIGDPADRAGVGRQERRTVSLLFVDLVGFSGMAEQLDPEDVRRLQVDYFATASAVIHRYGGLIEKYIGDAVMAVFGVPVETEHDASRAVLAGLTLQRELSARPLAGRYRMRTRVGVATGEVLVDLDMARDAGQALVSGDAVATAARLQQHAPPGGVLVSTATHRATMETVRYDDPPVRVSLAGRSSPMQAWLATAPIDRQEPEDDEATSFVGRQQELDVLVGVLRRCVRDNQPQLVSVVGAHGLGKSRLARELRRRYKSSGETPVRWLVGRGLPYGEGAAYSALAEIVKGYAGILDTDAPAAARDRLTEALRDLAPEGQVARLADLLAPLVGLSGHPAAAVEAESAWRDLLLAMAREEPTVLTIEDLHYADPGMLRFLAQLVEAATDVPLFVLCTYRPELLEDHPTWAAILPGTLTVSLGPLRGAAFRALIEALLARHNLPAVLADRLVSITAGNPMYAVEYVRMLAERPAELRANLDVDLTVPDTVHGVLANRIDQLDRIERAVLHAAAVLGDRVWPNAIAAVLDSPETEAITALRALCRRDMLVELSTSTVAGEPELGFRHQLMRDAAYRRLPRAARAHLHRKAADWFRRLSAGRHDMAAAVAHHRIEALRLSESLGEDTTVASRDARVALTDAARAAFAVHAVESALGYATRALTLWPCTEEPGTRLAVELLCCRLSFTVDIEAFYRDGGIKDLARLTERMREVGDRAGEAETVALLGVAELMRAERGRAAEHLTEAVKLFADLPDSAANAEAYGELARLHMMEFRAEPAIAAARASWQVAERLGLSDRVAGARITEATSRYLAGDGAAVAALEQVLQECREQRLPAQRRAARNLAVLITEEGDLTRAMELEEESEQVHGGRLYQMPSHSEDALRAYHTGDWQTLLQAAEAYLDVDAAETTEWDLQLRAQRAWIRVLCGEPSGEDVKRCLDRADRSGFARLRLCAYAHAALCRVLEGDAGVASELVGRLAEVWATTPNTQVSEWLPAAGHASVLLAERGWRPAAESILGIAESVPLRTPWALAAGYVAAGATALAAGDAELAACRFCDAVAAYDQLGVVSDAVLAATWAARGCALAEDPAATGYLDRVRGFAERVGAPGLIALTR
ncbi:MAG TPA: adenylate/guanylate cyclase domain-containing protein [Micromonosporaceae bacterium]